MKVKELIHEIEKYPHDVISSAQLVSIGVLSSTVQFHQLLKKTNVPYFLFGRSTYRILKEELVNLITNKFAGSLEEEYDERFLIYGKQADPRPFAEFCEPHITKQHPTEVCRKEDFVTNVRVAHQFFVSNLQSLVDEYERITR